MTSDNLKRQATSGRVSPRGTTGGILAAALFGVAASGACADFALEPDALPASMFITPADTLITEGDQTKLTVNVLDESGNPIPGPPAWAPPQWHIQGRESSIALESDGTVTAFGGGDLRIIAQSAGMEAWTGLRVNPASIRLSAGAAYLNQAIQNVEGSVPILAGRDALLRVFAIGDETSFYQPNVAATFYRDGKVIHSAYMTPFSDVLPHTVQEGRMDRSYNALIPGEVLEPGTGVVIELDPEGVVPTDPGSPTRIPESGVLDLGVVRLPTHIQTIIPTLLSATGPDERVFAWTSALTDKSDQMKLARTLLPIGDMEVRVHETVTTDVDLTTESGWQRWIRQTRTMWITEGRVGYYYGVVRLPPGSRWGGLGYLNNPVSVGRDNDGTFAHELGHNMTLRHAPCGGAGGPDPNYPYDDGETGVWGYDIARNRLINPEQYRDLMGYCSPDWVSDYHFIRAFEHRVETEMGSAAAARSEEALPESVLLLWGDVGDDGVTLDPAFLLESEPALPEGSGPYRLEGTGPNGATVFSFSFTPAPLEHGGASFVYLVPYDRERDGALERVIVFGPEGSAELTAGSAPPMAIVRDRETGRIRAFLRDWSGGLNLVEGDTEILVSDGIPGGAK